VRIRPQRLLAIIVITTASACHRGSAPGASPTTAPDSSATITISRPVCPSTSPDVEWVRWPVDTLAIRLPPTFRPTTARVATRHRWASPDSTAIEIWFSDAPVLSVGGSGVAQFGGEGACTLTMGGRTPVIVVRYWVIFTGHTDTLFNAATATILAPGHAVDVALSGRSRPARDALLGALTALELPVAAAK